VTPLDLVLPVRRRIGYVRGAADAVPEALAAAGFPVEVLAPGAIGGTDLARYDAIVIGPRAHPGEQARRRTGEGSVGLVRARAA
jgi:hypothetical protein